MEHILPDRRVVELLYEEGNGADRLLHFKGHGLDLPGSYFPEQVFEKGEKITLGRIYCPSIFLAEIQQAQSRS